METLRIVKNFDGINSVFYYMLKSNDDIFFKISTLDSKQLKLDCISNCDKKIITKIKKKNNKEFVEYVCNFFIDKNELLG